MSITRNITRVVLKEVIGLPQFDAGHILEIRRDNGSALTTATETSDGNYAFTWTAENGYGWFYVDGSVKTAWGHLWLGEVTGSQNLDAAFRTEQPTTINNTLTVIGATTLATSLTGPVRADAGVISARLIINADISSSAAIDWTKISKSGANLSDIPTRSHTVLSDIGTNTHANIDTHIAATSGVHGATSANVASRIVIRAADGTIQVGPLSATFINCSGGIDVSGSANLSSSVTIAGAALLNSTLAVLSVTTLSGSLHGVGAVTFDSTLAVLGAATLSSSAHVVGNSTLDGNVQLATGKYIRNAYTHGTFGGGFQFDQSITLANQSYLEIDNLSVRGTLYANVFQKNVIKASNGMLYVSDASNVLGADAIVRNETVGYLIIKEPNFAERDIIQVSDLAVGAGLTVLNVFVRALDSTEIFDNFGGGRSQMEADGGGYRLYYLSYDSSDHVYSQNATLVRVGNDTNANRQGAVFLDASTFDGHPIVDIYDGRVSTATVAPRARLGYIGGISDTINGVAVAGYGLYSDNVFLKGGIVASFGKIGGWNIGTSTISSSGTAVLLDAANNTISVHNGDVKMFVSGSAYGISGSGFQLGSTNNIAGWSFTANDLTKVFDTDKKVALDVNSGNESIYFFDTTPASGEVRWTGLGRMYDGNSWTSDIGIGSVVYNGSGYDKTFWLSNNLKQIAGWGFNASQFSSSGASGGSDGALTTTGIVLNKDGWMSAPNFALGTSTSRIAGFGFNATTLSASSSSSQIIGGIVRTAAAGQTRTELNGQSGSVIFAHATGGSDDGSMSLIGIFPGGIQHVNLLASSNPNNSGLYIGDTTGSIGLAYGFLGPALISLQGRSASGFSTVTLNAGVGVATPSITIDGFAGNGQLKIGAQQVIGARKTGWGTPTGTLNRAALSDASSQPDVNRAVMALITDLISHGLIGA